jgi:hypothetical protein
MIARTPDARLIYDIAVPAIESLKRSQTKSTIRRAFEMCPGLRSSVDEIHRWTIRSLMVSAIPTHTHLPK